MAKQKKADILKEMAAKHFAEMEGTQNEEDNYEQTEIAGLPAVEEIAPVASAPAPVPATTGKKRGRPRKEDTALKTTYVRATITPEYKKKLRIVLAEQGKTEDAFVSELVMKAIDKYYAAIIGG
ncbi:MAG: hypothetical protein J6A83_09045 [Clostridia bacterium]|nr:hypothetical protein [Clostridia bacterium]